MKNKVEKLIAELSDIIELKEAVSSATELIEFGEYKIAIENLTENIIEDNYIISHQHYKMLEDILSVYNDEYDKQLLRLITKTSYSNKETGKSNRTSINRR